MPGFPLFTKCHAFFQLIGTLAAIATFVAATPSASAASNVPGVTDDAITLGQSAAFTGPAAKLGEAMREGALTYFEAVNARGGVHGRQIRMVSVDDGYEPERAVANTKRLINEDKVFALFGYVGTPTSYAVLPVVTEAKIPYFAPFTGAQGLREPLNPYVFNIRASYFDETEQLVEWLLHKSKKKIAVFYQDDSYGQAGLSGVNRAMDKRKLQLVATGTVKRNTVEVDEAVKTIRRARPDAVIMIGAYKACAEFIKQTMLVGGDPVFMNVSFVGSEALAAELGDLGGGVIISQVVPYYADPSYDVSMEFRAALKQRAPDHKASFNNLEGYIAAKAFVEGLQRAGRDLTREKFKAALETFQRVNLGGVYISYSPKNHNGSDAVLLTVIVNGQGSFAPFWGEKRAAAK